MNTYFLAENDLFKFYDRIAQDYELFVPVKINSRLKVKCEFAPDLPSQDYGLKRYSVTPKEKIVFNGYRCVEPARALLTHPKEDMCSYFDASNAVSDAKRPAAVCGIKNCDLFSLKVQDFVFLGGNEQDHLYKQRREQSLIISSDCPAFKEACFCRAFDINPHVNEGFDFNMSLITGGYLVDVSSDKAQRLARDISVISAATSEQMRERENGRRDVIKRMEGHISHHKIPKKDTLQQIVAAGYNSKVFTEQALTCVECGGCVFMCDTCHCFLLADEKDGPIAKRIRVWDGCLYKNFGRVAGEGNPLKLRFMRLRNRYIKKFDFFVNNMGIQACCGCGRCIDVCPGRIDIRYILRRLYEENHAP